MFSVTFPTRHTDTFASTGFVHAGVLLALTEMAYASFEPHCGISKPPTTVAMQRETRAVYAAPLRWQEGAVVEVVTVSADERGFEQEFTVKSAADGHLVATFVHSWIWLDTLTGKRVLLTEDVQQRYLAG